MPGSKKVAKSSKKDVNPCKRRTDKIYKYAYKQAFKSTTFYMYCLGCVPVSSTKKPVLPAFLCSGRESGSFAVFIRPPPNLPSGGGLVASLRKGYGCAAILFIRAVNRAAVAAGQ